MRPHSGAALIAVVALLIAVRPADAQGDDRLTSRLDASTASAVQTRVDSARTAGLPTEPLVLKALEGASKGARGPMIAAAVGRLHAQLGQARAALGAASTEAELVSGASALQAGVQPSTLRALREARSSGSLATALSVLADLIARGVPVETAAETILALVRDGVADDRLVGFRVDVEREIGRGMAPAAAARERRGPPGVPPGKGSSGRGGGQRPPMP